MVVCFIGLGSNLGNRKENIKLAISRINKLQKTKVIKNSSIIETLPVGGPPQGKFLNAVIKIKTDLSPRRLLSYLQDIEVGLGRVRTIKNGPRTIDLDILLYGDKKISEKDLILPHPRIKEREFVLKPLFEIAPRLKNRLFDENNKKN